MTANLNNSRLLTFIALANIRRHTSSLNAWFLTLRDTLASILSVQLESLAANTLIRSRANTVLTRSAAPWLTNPIRRSYFKSILASTNPWTHAVTVQASFWTIWFTRPIRAHPIQIIADANPRSNALAVDAIVATPRNAFAYHELVAIVALAYFRLSAESVGAVYAIT